MREELERGRSIPERQRNRTSWVATSRPACPYDNQLSSIARTHRYAATQLKHAVYPVSIILVSRTPPGSSITKAIAWKSYENDPVLFTRGIFVEISIREPTDALVSRIWVHGGRNSP
jgi:hypothetical protein